MLHTKFDGRFLKGFYPRRLHIKFGFDRGSGFGEDV